MQQFTVPQFIDVEPKIIGPITARQFVLILIYIISMAACYKVADLALFLTIAIPGFLITMFFAFVKINGRPSHYFVLNVIQTLKKPGLRVWNHKIRTEDVYKDDKSKNMDDNLPTPHKDIPENSRLTELSLVVDTAGAYDDENKY